MKEDNNKCIVIPIYKKTTSSNEEASLRQAFKVLNKHKFYFVCSKEFNLEWYQNIAIDMTIDLSIERYDNDYFSSIDGYNRLLLSEKFYERFENYDFMLIYQLDAWVFCDELDYWCKKNYSYIGAPWFKNWGQDIKSYMGVGNGGFSLRKIEDLKSAIIKIKQANTFGYRMVYYFLKFVNQLYKPFNKGKCKFNELLFLPEFWFTQNEDIFFGINLPVLQKNFSVIQPEQALKFSFEAFPKYSMELNNNKLPFGCHAWEKNDLEFWKKHIIINS